MKKFGLLCLALVLALGALGVGYASWTDTIFIKGEVCTGSVCLEIEDGTFTEINNCAASEFAADPDLNWCGWIEQLGSVSCPMGYAFENKPCTDKDVAYPTFNAVDNDGDGNWDTLEITIHNAYPHYLTWITFEVCNCGTIPVILQQAQFEQSPFVLIEYRNGFGEQLHPGQCHEVSLFVGVVQHAGHYVNDVWVVDDLDQPMLPQDNNCDITFDIEVEGIQWAECDDLG